MAQDESGGSHADRSREPADDPLPRGPDRAAQDSAHTNPATEIRPIRERRREGAGHGASARGQAEAPAAVRARSRSLRHRGQRENGPAETAVAVNSLDERELSATQARWLARKPLYQRDAREELVGVPREYEAIRSDPAAHAASVLKAARYHTIDIRVAGKAIIVRTANETTRQQYVYRTIRDARTGFEELGINAALHGRGWNPGDIRNEANNALDRGADAAILRLTGDGSTTVPNLR